MLFNIVEIRNGSWNVANRKSEHAKKNNKIKLDLFPFLLNDQNRKLIILELIFKNKSGRLRITGLSLWEICEINGNFINLQSVHNL